MNAHRRWRRRAIRLAQVAIVGTATWFLAVPQLPAAWAAIGAIGTAPTSLIVLAGLLAFAALVAYAQLVRVALGREASPGLWHTFGIVTTSLGVSNVLPAGSAAGSIVTFRMLERAGVPRDRAAVSMAVASLGSALVLNVLLGVGLVALVPAQGLTSGAIAAVPAVLLLAAVVCFVRAVLGGSRRLYGVVAWLGRRWPRVVGDRLVRALDTLTDQLTHWRANPGRVRRAVGWAVLNWLIDVAALWVVLLAVGVGVNPIVVLVAFALANIAATVPITAGGLGVVELTLAGTLVGFGAPAAATAVGVAIYRLFNFWLPIPISAIAFLATRVATQTSPSPRELVATRS